jgi:hypothetical protein
MPDSIWIIEDLKAGLPLRTESALVDGIILYPFQFDRPVIDRSNLKAASAGTLQTDARGPILLVRNPFSFFGKGMEEVFRQGRSEGCRSNQF